uniref:Uncharacterized protein n=1 Tax=Anguilla anguilla TaxID=7936 RepID=A0A0E9UU72_ANGAN
MHKPPLHQGRCFRNGLSLRKVVSHDFRKYYMTPLY